MGVVLGLFGWIILKDTGFWTLMAVLVMAPLAYLFQVYVDGKSLDLVYLALGLAALLLLKRLTSNWQRPSPDYSLPRVLLYRLLFDRDVPRQVTWVQRKLSKKE